MKIDLTLKLEDAIIARPELSEKYANLFNKGHFGTHVDTHLETNIPLEYIDSRGIMFDLSKITDRDIELSDFNHNSITENDFVIFKTGMMSDYGYGTHSYFHEHTQLSQSVIDYLIAKKIRFIGIDAAGVRRSTEHIIADEKCEASKIYIVENLTNLDLLEKNLKQRAQNIEKEFRVLTLWLDHPGKTGLPCRVIACFKL